ncbi:MAG: 6-pyruvoyl-tetrahydropterin synthase-related protein [Acidobacteriota bacterium]
MEFLTKLNPKNRSQFDVGVILLVSILLTLPFYFWGIPGGADMPQHYQFAQTFYDSLSNGTIYPSWSADTNYGYGDVGIRFYPPLTYYVLSFFRLIAGNWYEASCLAIAIFFFFGGFGVYKWSREYFAENSSLIGGLCYLLIPYHLFQIYQGTLIAEFAASAILPFCFLYTARICQNSKFSDVFKLALTFGLLILTHIPTTVMASLALTIYVLFSLQKCNFIQTILKLMVAIFLSLLTSSFYWTRMITELDWVKHNTETFSSGEFSYQANFAFPFLAKIFGVELTSGKSFLTNMVLVMLGILLPILTLHFINSKEKKQPPMFNLLAMTIFSLLMVVPLSLPIWDNVQFLQKIQFPWRWLIFVSLGTAMFAAASFETILAYFKTPQRYLSLLAVGLFSVSLLYNWFWVVNHLFYIPKDFFVGMTTRLKTAKSNDCWWTNWMPSVYSEENKKLMTRLEFLPSKIVIHDRPFEIKTWAATERVFSINEGNAGQATIATMYYPHWKAMVNGQNVSVTPSENGLISFPVSTEKSEVQLFFQEPPLVIFAFYISGLAWLIILGLLLKTRSSND